MDTTNLDFSKQVDYTEQPQSIGIHTGGIHRSGAGDRVGHLAESILEEGFSESGHDLSGVDLSQRHIFDIMQQEIHLAEQFLDPEINIHAVDAVDENGDTGLMRALYTFNTEAVKTYLEAWANPNKRDNNGLTPLMLAAKLGYSQALEMLLERNADVQAVDDKGMMAIDYLEASYTSMFRRDDLDLPKAILREMLIKKACEVRGITPQLYEEARTEWQDWNLAQQDLGDVNFEPILGYRQIEPRDIYKWVYNHIFADQKLNPLSNQHVNRNLTVQDIQALLDFCESTSGGDWDLVQQGSDLINLINSSSHDDDNEEEEDAKPLNPLWRAMQIDPSDPDMVHILLKAGVDKELPDETGLSPLMFAAKEGQVDILKHLLKAGANRNAQNTEGRSALMLATMSDQHETMTLLLADSATDKELRDHVSHEHISHEHGPRTALLLALREGDPDEVTIRDQTVNLLLDYRAHAENRDAKGRTTLMLAIERGYPTATDRLLRFFYDKGKLEDCDKIGNTAFIRAVNCNNLHAARCLLESGANIEARNKNGYTGLLTAALRNREELINLMLAPPRSVPAKADIEVRNRGGETALIVAARRGHKEALECLLNANANIEAVSVRGMTALDYAIETGDISIIECLIEYGADINHINPFIGHTPILNAHIYENLSSTYPMYPRGIPQLLMAEGADLEASKIVRDWVLEQQKHNPDWTLDPELTFYEVLEIARQST